MRTKQAKTPAKAKTRAKATSKAKTKAKVKTKARAKTKANNMAFVAYLIALGDDQLVLAQNLTKWCGFAPTLEEDIALSNMGLDILGQARELYTYAAALEGKGRSEDDIAFSRAQHEYHNLLLLEQPNGDFAQTMLRQFFYAAFMVPFWDAMQASCRDATLQAIAAKAVKEMAYHLRHSAEWVIRLAQGTDESRARIMAALDGLHIYTGEMFEPYRQAEPVIAAWHVPNPPQLKPHWQEKIREIFAMADLPWPDNAIMQSGGRAGRHTENLGHLLADLQYMQRSYPGLSW